MPDTDVHDEKDRELRERVTVLLKSQPLAVLATTDGGLPHASLVAFTSAPDLSRLFFLTKRKTRKFNNISNNPAVALLIDDRKNQGEDFTGALSVTALGAASEVIPAERKILLPAMLIRHPELEDFAADPQTAFMVARITRYLCVSRFERTDILIP